MNEDVMEYRRLLKELRRRQVQETEMLKSMGHLWKKMSSQEKNMADPHRAGMEPKVSQF